MLSSRIASDAPATDDTLSAAQAAEVHQLWDQLRAEAISDADRHEIDEIFSRQIA